jgi:hypothetical protein
MLSLKYFSASGSMIIIISMTSMSSMCLRLQRCLLILQNTYDYCVIMLYTMEQKSIWVRTTLIVVHLVIYCVHYSTFKRWLYWTFIFVLFWSVHLIKSVQMLKGFFIV